MNTLVELSCTNKEEIFEHLKAFSEKADVDDRYEVKCKNCILKFYKLRGTDAKLGVYLADFIEPNLNQKGWLNFASSVVIDMIPFMLEEFRELDTQDILMVWDAWYNISLYYPKFE